MASGERIRVARQAVPMDAAALAAQIEIGEAELLAYEDDEKSPDPPMIWKIAKAIGIELSFLLQTMPLTDVSYLPALSSLSNADRDVVIARGIIWLEHYLNAEAYLEDEADYIDFAFPENFPVQ